MSEEQEFPSTDYILGHWLTTRQAATRMNITTGHVRQMCIDRVLRAMRIGDRWYIDPDAADDYKKYEHRK